MEILKAIEAVDHTNERAMFALNEKVYEWLISIKPETSYGQFVFSRDALKAIRPKDLHFNVHALYCCETFLESIGLEIGWSATLIKSEGSKVNVFESPVLVTEELAELHAIISAIEYERRASTVREG